MPVRNTCLVKLMLQLLIAKLHACFTLQLLEVNSTHNENFGYIQIKRLTTRRCSFAFVLKLRVCLGFISNFANVPNGEELIDSEKGFEHRSKQ